MGDNRIPYLTCRLATLGGSKRGGTPVALATPQHSLSFTKFGADLRGHLPTEAVAWVRDSGDLLFLWSSGGP